jgi:hypothetical protein
LRSEKEEVLPGNVEFAGAGHRKMVTVANSDGWIIGGLLRKKYTIRVVHVGGDAGVHDPAGVLERHLV